MAAVNPLGVGEFYAHARDRDWTCAGPSPDAIAFHRGLDGYAVTPLVDLPEAAAELGVGRVLAKVESARLGLPAFKALGASWAIDRVLGDRTERLTVVTATDGNHGRAVARFARLRGHDAAIYIPDGVSEHAVQAIRDEGAEVHVVGGPYDNAVRAAARAADAEGAVLVQDTAWDGYEVIPAWIVEGYATLFTEIDSQLRDQQAVADLVVVPAGVGSLLHAALAHYRSRPGGPAVVSVEPVVAACMAPSLMAGEPVTVDTGITVMSGLNCGTPSSLAWPFIEAGLDAAVAVDDDAALQAVRDLSTWGVSSGPCGGAGLAALRAVLAGSDSATRRAHLGLEGASTVVFLVTEGADANPVEASAVPRLAD